MKVISVYVDEIEKELLEEASARTGMTVSAFCRYAALSLAKRVLRGRRKKRVEEILRIYTNRWTRREQQLLEEMIAWQGWKARR